MGAPRTRRAAGLVPAVRTAGTSPAARSLPLGLVNAVEDTAVGEELLLRLAPVPGDGADREEVDLAQLGVLLEHVRVARAVVVAGEDLLGLLGVEEAQVLLR